MSPLVITGEAAGGGALPLPFPTAHAPTLTSATEARMTTVISLPSAGHPHLRPKPLARDAS